MKPARISDIKKELNERPPKELLELCLSMAKFKKENKELLTYLLYEASNEAAYIQNVKVEMDEDFEEINKESYYYIKKSVRKILRNVKKHIRFSKKKETEVELLIYFCSKLNDFRPSINGNIALKNLFIRQMDSIRKTISTLHEDLQYDFEIELNSIK